MGAVLGVLLLGGLILLFTRGHPKPKPKGKEDRKPLAAAASLGVQDAFAYAKDLEGRLRGEPKYARLYLVPSAATPNQKQGKVVVMGEIAGEDELQALQESVARAGVPVTLEWQVTVQPVTPPDK